MDQEGQCEKTFLMVLFTNHKVEKIFDEQDLKSDDESRTVTRRFEWTRDDKDQGQRY